MVRKKWLEHQFLKYYAIERKVYPNIELRSDHLAVVSFLWKMDRKITRLLWDRHLKLCLCTFALDVDNTTS